MLGMILKAQFVYRVSWSPASKKGLIWYKQKCKPQKALVRLPGTGPNRYGHRYLPKPDYLHIDVCEVTATINHNSRWQR